MPEESAEQPREFKPLADIGAINLTEDSELKFYVDEYKGYKYGSIRTFVKRDSYSGPTKAGITMNAGVLAGIIEALEKLPAEPATTTDTELARLPKKAGLALVVRITIFKDTTGIDLREWVEEPTYTGWSKKGVRIPYNELPKTVKMLKAMTPLLAKAAGKN
jgi:hypothetical protein